ASMRTGSPRLYGPRQQGGSLKDRALLRSQSVPMAGIQLHSPPLEADSLSQAMREHALKRGEVRHRPSAKDFKFTENRTPTGIGKWNYVVPESAVSIMANFKGNPVPFKGC
ncbi:unnamed protein product, partial [Polarella glacialis]